MAITWPNRRQYQIDPSAHAACCKVCNSPYQELIERMYKQLMSLSQICDHINSIDPTANLQEHNLYKHVVAFDLDLKRVEKAADVIKFSLLNNVDKLKSVSEAGALKLLELHGRAQGAFVDRLEVDNLQTLDTGELRALLRDALSRLKLNRASREFEYAEEGELENSAETEGNEAVHNLQTR